MLTSEQLSTFKQLSENNKIMSLYGAIKVNLSVDSNDFPEYVTFTTTCSTFNALYSMQEDGISVDTVSDEDISSYIEENLNSAEDVVKDIVHKEITRMYDVDDLSEYEKNQVKDILASYHVNDLTINIVDQDITISGYLTD